MLKPRLCYTIWFSQRTGSTLLTTALAATGIAGKPEEWYETPEGVGFLAHYGVETPTALRDLLWARGTTPNRVFGAKVSFHEPMISEALSRWRELHGCPPDASRPEVWAHAFPNHRHIVMTRRNTVRQAVSWWRAIQSQAWHRPVGDDAAPPPEEEVYSFDAIDRLVDEVVMREAGIQAFLAEAGIVPLTVVYEDFVADYAGTIRQVLAYLDLDTAIAIPPPAFERLSDAVAEAWVQRYREERQAGWTYRGW
ncbi:MAG: Stf0 family sulfotransferase [Anaerolineae bacterium]